MEKGLGITALIVAVIAIFVPVVSIYVVWIALVLAAVAGFLGDKICAVAAIATSLVNVMLLSPMTLAAFSGERLAGKSFLLTGTVILFIASVAGLIVGASKNRNKQDVKVQ